MAQLTLNHLAAASARWFISDCLLVGLVREFGSVRLFRVSVDADHVSRFPTLRVESEIHYHEGVSADLLWVERSPGEQRKLNTR